jgi:ethanolaminephosphotransferase
MMSPSLDMLFASNEKETPGTSASSVSSDISNSSHKQRAGSWLLPSAATVATTIPVNDRWYYYLSDSGAERLPHYQYRGADLSLMYKYVLSPFAAWCVDNLTPTWVAPNAITFFGLTWMMLAYFIIWYWCPGLYEANTDIATTPEEHYSVPAAIFLLNGFAMLIYQTLDNMDGKQARKTGTSSPLGLLFDHGCDALNLILGSANWIAAMALIPGNVSDLLGEAYDGSNIQSKSLLSHCCGGDAILACILIFSPMIAFYISTWEQYYTGTLILPPFNGPSEGLVLGASLSIASFFMGPMFWQGTSLADGAIAKLESSFGNDITSFLTPMHGRVRNMDLVVLSALVSLIQEVVLKTSSVVCKYGVQTLRTTTPHLILVASTLVMVHFDSTIFLRNPRTMLHLISGLFTEQTTQLMMDHMVDEEYEVGKRWCAFPQVFLAVWIMTELSSMQAVDTFLVVYTSGLWVYLAFKISVQICEICDVLGIYCFDIVTVHPKKLMGVRDEIVGTTVAAVARAGKKTD